MHEAEAMLMDTGAVVPITYYTDPYMMKTGVEGVYDTIEGFKYFMYATYEGADTLRINLASEPDRLDPALNYTLDLSLIHIWRWRCLPRAWPFR